MSLDARRLATSIVEADCSGSFCSLKESLRKCCHDDKQVDMERTHTKGSRSRDQHPFRISRRSITCPWALVLILLSVVLYLDRTLEQPFGRRPRSIARRWESPHSIAAANDDFDDSGFASIRPGKNLHESRLRSKVEVPRRFKVQGTGALHGMGVTFRRGSRAMNELMVAHLDETTTPAELRLFLRTLHRSGVTARADVVFLFPEEPDDKFMRVLQEEERSFWRLMLEEQSSAPIHRKKKPKKQRNSTRAASTNHVDNIFLMPNSSIAGFNIKLPGRRLQALRSLKEVSQMADSDHSALLFRPSRPTFRRGLNEDSTSERGNSQKLTSGFPPRSPTAVSTVMMPNSSISDALSGLRSKEAAATRWKLYKENIRNRSSSSTNSSEINADSMIFNMPIASMISPFNIPAFWQSREEGIQGKGRRLGSALWGTAEHYVHGSGSTNEEMTAAVKWGDWGSIAGFDMQDMERDEVIKGFIDNPAVPLRRWTCYKLLLGMVKRLYRNVFLTEVRGVVILGDVMSATRDSSFGSSIYLFGEDRTWNQAHRGPETSLMEEAGASERVKLDRPKDDEQQLARYHTENGSDRKLSGALQMDPSQEIRYKRIGRDELSFIHDVYGEEVWKNLNDEDNQKAVLGSGIMMGNMKSIQALSDAMVTEIVRVAAIIRKNRQPFHDQPVLNYLVLKSAVLNRKVSEKLLVLPNWASPVHLLPGSKQKSVFLREEDSVFHALQGLKHELVAKETCDMVFERIHADICFSLAGLRVYEDCSGSPLEI